MRAFTLVELMVAVGLAAALAAMLVAIGQPLAREWMRSAETAAMEQTARRILDQIEADLEAARPFGRTGTWLAGTLLDRTDLSGLWDASGRGKPAAGSVRFDSSRPEAWRFGVGGVWLRFLTAGSGGGGAPVAVAYQLIRRRNPEPGRLEAGYYLHRAEVRRVEADGRPGVFESGHDLGFRDGSPYWTSSGNNDGSVPGDPFSVKRPLSANSVISDRVVDFGVRLLVDSDPNREFPRMVPSFEADAASPPIAAIDVFLRILSEEGRLKLIRLEQDVAASRPARSNSEADWWWSEVEANSRVFWRRIEGAGGDS